MKKAGLFVIVLLILSVLPLISAQDEVPGLGSGEVPVAGEIEQGQQVYEQYTTAENKTQYLKTEWNKILLKHKYIGPVMKVVNAVFEFCNPFFKIVLGVEYALSWAFIFAIAIWLILFFFLNPISSQMLNNGLTGGIAAFAITSLIGLSGVIRKAVDVLTLVIAKPWIAWLALAIAVIMVFLSETLGKAIKAKIKKAKMKEEEQKTEESQKVIQMEGELAKKKLDSYKEQ